MAPSHVLPLDVYVEAWGKSFCSCLSSSDMNMPNRIGLNRLPSGTGNWMILISAMFLWVLPVSWIGRSYIVPKY